MNFKLTYITGALALLSAVTLATAQERPADIVSPIADQTLANKVSPADARKAGRMAYEKPTPQNSSMLFIDHQIGLMAGVRDFQQASGYKSNVLSLAKMAKALDIPVLLTTSNAQWQNGDMLPDLNSGAWSKYEADAAMQRMTAAGAQLNTVFALGAELQADWKRPSGMKMLDPFISGLPEYGWVLQNFWNNADPAKRPVKDPFGMVKRLTSGPRGGSGPLAFQLVS